MAQIIDGKAIAADIRQELKQKVIDFESTYHIKPCLAVIIVGDDPASQVYVRNKQKACEEIGFRSIVLKHPANETEANLLMAIDGLNNNPDIHGILVQLPLPKHLNEEKILLAINPKKDVDAFHPKNVGRLMLGNPSFKPCTPAGVLELLKRSNVDIAGKECVIVGRSNIVGKPLAMMLLQENGTVTICHSKTKDLYKHTQRADILISAIGKAEFFDSAANIKPGAVVIDVGINRTETGKLVGDVKFENVIDRVAAITPVPGGVGPMTIAMLMQNTLEAAIYAASNTSNGEFTTDF